MNKTSKGKCMPKCTCHAGFGAPSVVFRAIDCPKHGNPSQKREEKK